MKVYAALLAVVISPHLIAATQTSDHANTELQSPNVFKTTTAQYPKVSTSLAFGVLSGGKVKEIVYNNNFKLSQLDWEIKTTPTAHAEFSLQLSPLTSINLKGWSTLKDSTNTMNDYDWLDPNKHDRLTDWSNHPNTKLNYANEIDINLNKTLISTPNYQVGALVGYQNNNMSWTSKGGTFQYSEVDQEDNYLPGSALANRGEFDPNTPGIAYQQKFKTPYLGLSAQYKFRKLELNSTLKYSPWVKAQDTDHHYARDIEFKTEVKDSHFYGLNFNAGYYVKPNLKLFSEVNWTEFRLGKGQLNYTSNPDQTTLSLVNGGGISNQHVNFNLGAQLRF